ncbi:MAG: tRNA (adenosine(37)-N6)-threonylcarbamoyltransferase complex transferase subunit TsaD [Armatimonadetes bacterium]|nr:tRNA (adenosine(37)-N6)-threonylcarbamoyltransferase complex transferase subunit TsaD [Armatimonadota bacterium]
MKNGGSCLILGIESSCDETAASVVRDGREMLSNVIASQVDLHARYGGVVPEVASRKHVEKIQPVIAEALGEAGVGLDDLSAVAVTCGPGLLGSLLVGVSAAKALAMARRLPLLGVHHLEGHIYSNFLVEPGIRFPALCLIVSGGHSDLMVMEGHGLYRILGRTRDDAAGEAFDKAARAMGLGYPGGPAVDRAAAGGDPQAVPLPRALMDGGFDFSFSGLKTAVLRALAQPQPPSVPDLAASFQKAVVDVLTEKTERAARRTEIEHLLLCGGVAANRSLRAALAERAASLGIPLTVPPIALCTDNAAMIACAGYYRFVAGERHTLNLDTRANLPFPALEAV